MNLCQLYVETMYRVHYLGLYLKGQCHLAHWQIDGPCLDHNRKECFITYHNCSQCGVSHVTPKPTSNPSFSEAKEYTCCEDQVNNLPPMFFLGHVKSPPLIYSGKLSE